MNDKEFETWLGQELAELPKQLSPERDLWPGLEHALANAEGSNRLSAKERKESRWLFRFAASVVLVGMLGLFIYQFPGINPGAQDDNQNGFSYADIVSLLQTEHEQNKQALLVEYQDQQVLLPDWQEQMRQLEEAEAVIYNALKQDSSNLELLKILRRVQTQQLNLIDSVYGFNFQII